MDLQQEQRIVEPKKKKVYSKTLDPKKSYLKRIYTAQKCDANPNHRNIEWQLSLEEWTEIVQQNCHICGSEPVFREGKLHESAGTKVPINGLDRIDSDNGYLIYNVRACCSKCNYMKHRMSKDKFLQHIKKIWNFNFANL